MISVTITLKIPRELWVFISSSAADRSHYKGYSIQDMIESKPQKDQILKWLHAIRENKMQYKRKYK